MANTPVTPTGKVIVSEAEDRLARGLCPPYHTTHDAAWPCARCKDAALRVWAHRQKVLAILTDLKEGPAWP